jgi:hypothetical protein
MSTLPIPATDFRQAQAAGTISMLFAYPPHSRTGPSSKELIGFGLPGVSFFLKRESLWQSFAKTAEIR